MGSAIDKYLELRAKIDERSNQLHELHHDKMKCKKGCDECCMSFDIFPVEFYAIKQQLDQVGFSASDLPQQSQNDENCVFLKDGVCSIYETRPIICRTHGLPFLYVGEEENWELSYCPMNFEGQAPEFFHVEKLRCSRSF
jgi:Fe-S-cluster containining protein